VLQVICLDNFFTGTKENLAHLLPKENFELIRHDVVNPILLEVDEIYHLACPASPIHYKCVSGLFFSHVMRMPCDEFPQERTLPLLNIESLRSAVFGEST
jgi:hypothetical protein